MVAELRTRRELVNRNRQIAAKLAHGTFLRIRNSQTLQQRGQLLLRWLFVDGMLLDLVLGQAWLRRLGDTLVTLPIVMRLRWLEILPLTLLGTLAPVRPASLLLPLTLEAILGTHIVTVQSARILVVEDHFTHSTASLPQ